MMKSIYKIFFAAVVAFAAATAQCIAQDDVMRSQADEFLRNMPAGLQRSQASAIMSAIGGDNTALEAVRRSRNAAPEISSNVAVRSISPTLRLYEPVMLPEDGGKLPLLIYFHGGGWTFGSLNSCARFCDAMAATGKMKVLAVDYRLAPEHPFPCGLDDCKDAIKYACSNADTLNIDAASITVGGDSSGGNLAIASALSNECRGLVKSLVVFYPVTKAFADGSASWKKYGNGYALDAELMNLFNKAYIGNSSAGNPLVDVGLNSADVLKINLPPTLLIAAGRDILCDQGAEFAQKAGGNVVTRIEFPSAVHLFITVPGQDEAFHRAVALATNFITKK